MSKPINKGKLLPIGNCPYCDTEQGSLGGWGGSDEMFADYKQKHDLGHPEYKPNSKLEEEWEKEFDNHTYDTPKGIITTGNKIVSKSEDFIGLDSDKVMTKKMIIYFFKSLLAKRDKELIEKMEGMKRKVPRIQGKWFPEDERNEARNRLLDDILKLIK